METYSQKITFNGKSYSTKDEMPVREREVFEKLTSFFKDQNQNYVPDRFEASGAFEIGQCSISAQVKEGAKEILINGRSYANPNDMTDEDRRVYQSALALLDRNGNGIPDAFEVLSETEVHAAFGKGFKPKDAASCASGVCGVVWKGLTLAALATIGYVALTLWQA